MTIPIVQKQCSHCKNIKPLTPEYFYKRADRRSGFRSRCKECSAASAKTYNTSPKGRERDKAYAKEYRQRMPESVRRKLNDGKIAYRKRNPLKTQARDAVGNATRLGLLPLSKTKKCRDCGKQARHYHHESYEPQDWLTVIPLCQSCHAARHR